LIQLLQAVTTTELVRESEKSLAVRALISDMGRGLTIQKAMESPKIFQVKKSYGAETVVKILSVVIFSFCHSVKASKTMDEIEIVDCAEGLMIKYSHDSIKDIILALKQAKLDGKTFYNSISEMVIYEIVGDYMEKKSSFIEKREHDQKSLNDGSVRTESGTILREREIFQEKMDKINENKKLKEVQQEVKELNKVADFIKKNAKNIE
jgi:hypothetical protein